MNDLIIGVANITAALFIAIVLVGNLLSGRGENKHENVFSTMLWDLLIVLLCQSGYYLITDPSSRLKFIMLIIAFSAYYVLLGLFSYYVWLVIKVEKSISRLWITGEILTALLGCLFLLYGIVIKGFGISYNIPNASDIWYYVGQVFAYLVGIMDFAMVLKYRKCFSKYQFVLYMCFLLAPLLVAVIRSFFGGPNLLMVSIAVMVFAIYMMERVEKQHSYLLQKAKMSEVELSLMIQQVHPHFMYNVLNSIYYLCDSDPALAQDAIGDFSDYLRANLVSLTTAEPISLEKEIASVKTYVSLEKLRFGDKLIVDYDLEDFSFYLPPLAVRSLVENAIKHGVNKTDHPLHVLVSSREYDDRYELSVKDDGPGYRYGVFADNERKHIGIENLRKRLDLISHGTLEISGRPNEGTLAVITIKK